MVMWFKPALALAMYIITLYWYPGYVAVSFGTIDLPVGRIVVSVLLLRCLMDSRIRKKFSWNLLDFWVALSMVIYVSMVCFTQPGMNSVINRGGFITDTWFAYLVARLTITDTKELAAMIKLTAIGLIPLAMLGAYESVRNVILFKPMMAYCPWTAIGGYTTQYEPRWGFTRSFGPFSHPILFGCCFALFFPLVYYLRHEGKNWKYLVYVICGFLALGAISSMSSGSWIMFMIVIAGLILERFKHSVKPFMVLTLTMSVFVIIISNRPIHHVVVSYINPLSGSGWHRARMIDAAFSEFDKWWVAGYGGKDPKWGEYVQLRNSDITNEFLLAGVNYGLGGIVVFCCVLAEAFRALIVSYKRTRDRALRSLYWGFGCALVALIMTWMSVSFFGQIVPLFYVFLGLLSTVASKKWLQGQTRLRVIDKRLLCPEKVCKP